MQSSNAKFLTEYIRLTIIRRPAYAMVANECENGAAGSMPRRG